MLYVEILLGGLASLMLITPVVLALTMPKKKADEPAPLG